MNLEGRTDTEVRFARKRFQIHDQTAEGVFPVFEGVAVCLPDRCMSDAFWKRHGNRSYTEQMRVASSELSVILKGNLVLEMQYTIEQLVAIHAGKDKIPGLTWHHKEDWLTMQLVDARLHELYKHTGGSYTWNVRNFQFC